MRLWGVSGPRPVRAGRPAHMKTAKITQSANASASNASSLAVETLGK